MVPEVRVSPPRRTAKATRGRLVPAGQDAVVKALQEALRAADPQAILSRQMSLKREVLRVGSLSFDLARFTRVLVIGGGKASGKMALEVEKILGKRITGGAVNIPDYQRPRPHCERIVLHDATHPIPSVKGVRGVEKMLELVGSPTSKDLVVCLISGGGSALLPMPAKGVSLRDVQRTTELLLKSGAEIDEVNTVRKHLSAIKGGGLAEKLYPATVLSLIISDVVGNKLDSIASGPTVPDGTTYGDAETVLKKYSAWNKTPERVRRAIADGKAGKTEETPKKGARVFEHVSNVIVGGNKLPCEAAAESLRKMGYTTLILSTRIQGEAPQIGRLFSSVLTDIVKDGLPFPRPAAIVAGGETTVTMRGDGVGGRNQELALSAARGIVGLRPAYVASMGTDGVDGPTAAAGALVDCEVVSRATKLGLDPSAFLQNNDSNTFFKKLGGLIVTGPTGTNVNDIMIAVACK
jgi:glycerate 2-kinase